MLTLPDKTNRYWTITADKAVAGFLWTVYIHHHDAPTDTLEAITPGGVANGWTELDMTPRSEFAMLTAIMTAMGAEVGRAILAWPEDTDAPVVRPGKRLRRLVPATEPGTIPKPEV